MLSLPQAALAVLLLVGCSDPIEQYCREAVVLGQVFAPGGSASAQLDSCVDATSSSLDALSSPNKEQARACIDCIADTPEEECGCCTTTIFSTGETVLDITRNEGPCRTTCDTAGQRALCGF